MFRPIELQLVAVGQHLRDAKVDTYFSASADLPPGAKEPPPGCRRHTRVFHSMCERARMLAFAIGRRTLRLARAH